MQNKIRLYIFLFAVISSGITSAQTLSPAVTSTSGGYYVAGGKSFSWTLGETFQQTLINGNLVLTQGQQQPYLDLRLLNLRAFLEGYYIGSGQMYASLYNTNPSLYPSDYCDSIIVELHRSVAPFNTIISKNVILLTDGTASVHFTGVVPIGTYYIVVKHHNSLETWSKFPVLYNGSAMSYNFTAP